MILEFQITKNDGGLKHTKINKIGSLPTLGSFHLKNGPFRLWLPTSSIGNALTDVRVNFGKNNHRISDHQKNSGLQHTKIYKIGVLPTNLGLI